MSHEEYMREMEALLQQIQHLQATVNHMNREARAILEMMKKKK